MENQIYNKPMYKCGICDEIYPTIAERMKCEQSCLKKQEEEEKKIAEKKKKAEQITRKAEVEAAVKHTNELIHAYIKDYGSYDMYCQAEKIADLSNKFSSKFFHNFIF